MDAVSYQQIQAKHDLLRELAHGDWRKYRQNVLRNTLNKIEDTAVLRHTETILTERNIV